MIELPILNYAYDEEKLGFDAPAKLPKPNRRAGEYIGIALVSIGLLVLLLAILAGIGRGSWAALLGSFGVMSVGAVIMWWYRYSHTTPGIKHDDTMFRNVQRRGIVAWGLGIFITGFYVVLYWYTDLQARGMPALFETTIRTLDPLSYRLTGGKADQWFLYGFLYTVLVLVMGFRMIMKYRHNRYQLIRTCSVMFFQLGLAFVLPGILKNLNQPEYYFTYFWPLKPEYGQPGGLSIWNSGTLGMFMIGFGIFAIVVLTPVLTYFFGKRWYCSWVCGCGGLAETLGDPWRQLSDKSNRAWHIERWLIHSVLIFVIVTTMLLWTNHVTQRAILGDATVMANKLYGFLIVQTFSGVVGVGFYPLMGSRVWCRFGCPMAAILGLFQRYFSRFRITTNGSQCMSCGNCSTYCEMGIDVRAYAQRGENIVRASCVGCGVCAAACPRGVLKLENGPRTDRYDGVDGGPLSQFIADLTSKPSKHR
ncbi:MAG: 4Fe-4S dicluster domain-containing protein [Planctomycetota bacterium]